MLPVIRQPANHSRNRGIAGAGFAASPAINPRQVLTVVCRRMSPNCIANAGLRSPMARAQFATTTDVEFAVGTNPGAWPDCVGRPTALSWHRNARGGGP